MSSSALHETSQTAELPFRGFSSPYEAFDEGLLRFLIAEQAICIARFLLEGHEGELTESSRGLTGLIRCWTDGGFEIARPINPAFGETRWAIASGDGASRAAAAAELALYLGSEGMPGAWSARIGRARRLRWGEAVLPAGDEVEVNLDGRRAEIRVKSAEGLHHVELQRDDGGWSCKGAEHAPWIGFDGWRITFLPRNALEMNLPKQALAEAVDTIEPAMVAGFGRAIEIVRTCVPAYIPWVGRVLTHAFLLHPQRGYVESGSVEDYFGFSHFSAYANAAGLAELLIHEASHQYFNILKLLGQFDDGSDKNLYYSTAKKVNRPIERIGVAYHAFANVLLYYRGCVAAGVDEDGWCARHLERWTEDLGVLEQPLRGNPALTRIGRSLCEPLIERLGL